MSFSTYADILRTPAARRALTVGLLIRIPMWAGAVIITLHVVSHLGRSYTEAGVITAAGTVAAAVSGPWRGRRLDRIGLRATVMPSLLVLTACWVLAPWVGYWALLPLAFVAGLFVVPTFSIIRQVLISAVDDERRKTALVLDSVAVELSFMIGPALGVLAATYWNTSWALLTCELLSVAGGLALWIINPPLLPESGTGSGSAGADPTSSAKPSLRGWMSPAVLAIIAASATATIVLSGTDVGIVASLRQLGHQSSIGWILTVWGAGSAVGGLIYGAMKRTVSAFVLVGLLGLTTIPVAWAGDRWSLAVLLFVAGLFCAPAITATIDNLSRAVPARVRGEAMGWHGSALTGGSAIGAPMIGFAIDHGGWPAGFVFAGAIGLFIAAIGFAATKAGRSGRAAPEPAAVISAGTGAATDLHPAGPHLSEGRG